MAKILAVDDDALARAVLVDALRGMHHEVVPASGGREALDRLGSGGFALVITDVMMPEMDGIELARHVAAMDPAPPVLLSSGIRGPDVAAEARKKGVEVAGFVAKPLHPDVLSRAISRAMGAVQATRGGWQVDDLQRPLEGPLTEQIPHRFLFLLHRVAGTGTVEIREGEREVRLVVRSGRIVHVAGVPGLLRTLPVPVPDSPTLADSVQAAMAVGVPPDEALRAAAEGLGAYLAGVGSVGTLRWDVHATVPPGAVGLDTPIPRMLALGFRAHRPMSDILSFWSTVDRLSVRIVPPDDAPEGRWGLDMTAQRAIRVGARFRTVGELIAAVISNDPDRRPEVLRTVDFLHRLGLLELSDAGAERSRVEAPTAERVAAATAQDRLGAAVLVETLAGWRRQTPVGMLGLGGRPKVTLDDLNTAWREATAAVHPDRYQHDGPEVKAAAAACYEALQLAHEAYTASGGLDEANAYLDAQAHGVRFVSERDRSAARLALRRGETLFRAREWKGADASFLAAMDLDPLSWPIPFYHAWCGWLSRRISAAEALEMLRPLAPRYPRQVAELHVVIGTILKLEGKVDAALAEFRIALEKDADNRDALRELRLHERRAAPIAAPSVSLMDNLRSTLTRPIGGAPAGGVPPRKP